MRLEFSEELLQDLRCIMGLDPVEELLNLVVKEIREQLPEKIVEAMYGKKHTGFVIEFKVIDDEPK